MSVECEVTLCVYFSANLFTGRRDEANYGENTSIIHACLSFKEHVDDISNSIHPCSDAGCLLKWRLWSNRTGVALPDGL